jgi:hypothetical protein
LPTMLVIGPFSAYLLIKRG